MYCTVVGCGKYSVKGKGFVMLPKNLERAKEWLKAAGLDKMAEEISIAMSTSQRTRFKFCKRHFLPTSFLKHTVAEDAVPRLYLPDPSLSSHHGVLCSKCNTIISDVRFKCVTCEDFDLCRGCENQDEHGEHNLLRIIKPISTIAANLLVKEASGAKNATSKPKSISHLSIEPTTVISVEPDKEDTSDDEPITKYISSKSELELPEEVKSRISNEVNRVLLVVDKSFVPQTKNNNKRSTRMSKTLNISTQTADDDFYPEVEFADVNDSNFQGDIKIENVLDMAPESVPEPVTNSKLFNLLTS